MQSAKVNDLIWPMLTKHRLTFEGPACLWKNEHQVPLGTTYLLSAQSHIHTTSKNNDVPKETQ